MVHQHFMLADNLTVLENIVLGAEPGASAGSTAARRGAGSRRSPTRTASASTPDRLVEDLGVGDRQRVEILKVLYRGARILILDEPTAVLVPQEVDELFGNLRELKSEGLTIIFISHKLDEVRSIADEITVIRRGTTVATVLPADVTARQLAELMVGSALPVAGDPRVDGRPTVVLAVAGCRARAAAGGRARRHLADHPRRRGARHRRRRGQRPGRAGRRDHGHAPLAAGTCGSATGDIAAWTPGAGGRPGSASSPRTGTGRA